MYRRDSPYRKRGPDAVALYDQPRMPTGRLTDRRRHNCNTTITVILNFGAVWAVCSSRRRGQKAETSTKTPVQDVIAHAYVQCPNGAQCVTET